MTCSIASVHGSITRWPSATCIAACWALCCCLRNVTSAWIAGAIRSNPGKRSIHDSANLFHLSEILSSTSSSLHFHDCSSWTSRIYREIRSELLSQSVVSAFSWNTLLLFRFAVSTLLGQVTFCRQLLLLQVCFSGLGLTFLVLSRWYHTIINCIFKRKPRCCPVKAGWNFRCHLCSPHQWAASMRLPLSQGIIWLIVITGLFFIVWVHLEPT